MTNLEIADALDARAAKAQRDFDHSFAAFGDDPPKQEPAEATLYRAAAQKLRQMDEALAGMLTVEPEDRGHVHTIAMTTRARELLGIALGESVNAWRSRLRAARSARTET